MRNNNNKIGIWKVKKTADDLYENDNWAAKLFMIGSNIVSILIACYFYWNTTNIWIKITCFRRDVYFIHFHLFLLIKKESLLSPLHPSRTNPNIRMPLIQIITKSTRMLSPTIKHFERSNIVINITSYYSNELDLNGNKIFCSRRRNHNIF